ncbi:hypothetical protein ACIBCN_44365 [Nocardia sp. NPDC051052]|uniref:hypothetical protein n=1 Tax=Nocardia sp. NPDC051052 TaxID=3364322 RepID=UPI00378A83D9
MVSQDVIAQLRQDITTAQDAGDDATSDRLRAELSAAIEAADDPAAEELPDLTGSGAAPQQAPAGTTRRAAEDLGPGSYEPNLDAAADVADPADEQVQEPPD